MNYFVLVVTSCLNTGGDCYKAPAYQDIPHQFECMYGAQPNLAKWLSQHPKRVIVKFTCVPQNRLKMYLNQGEA